MSHSGQKMSNIKVKKSKKSIKDPKQKENIVLDTLIYGILPHPQPIYL
jgi:hypothetical protein